jgi:O-acetyl-ADP-ribose deacetylase (regulator of RNase III)
MGDEPVTARSIRDSTLASLELATRHGVRRIAFPVLGSGIGGFDFVRAATIMRDAILESPAAGALQEIVLYGYGPEAAAELSHILG